MLQMKSDCDIKVAFIKMKLRMINNYQMKRSKECTQRTEKIEVH